MAEGISLIEHSKPVLQIMALRCCASRLLEIRNDCWSKIGRSVVVGRPIPNEYDIFHSETKSDARF
eukprot:89478-Amphidinium_carterae.2